MQTIEQRLEMVRGLYNYDHTDSSTLHRPEWRELCLNRLSGQPFSF